MSASAPCIPTTEAERLRTLRTAGRRVLERTIITREYLLADADSALQGSSGTGYPVPESAEVAPVLRRAGPSTRSLPIAPPARVIDGVLARVGMWLIDRSASRVERATARRAERSPRAHGRRRHRTAADIADLVDAGRAGHLKHFIVLPH